MMTEPRPQQKKTFSRRITSIVLWGFVSVLLVSIAMVLPLRWWNPTVTAFTLSDNRDIRLRDWRTLAELGTNLPLSVMAAEDQKFPVHFGIDFDAMHKALQDKRAGKPLRGASTITQQTAKNLFLWRSKTFLRKGIEAYFALLLEGLLPKTRILEIYLNIIEFGPNVYGATHASETFFGKTPDELTANEAAVLAAVLPNPKRFLVTRPSAYVLERQQWILEQAIQMQEKGLVNDLPLHP